MRRILVSAACVPPEGGGGIVRYVVGLLSGMDQQDDVELFVTARTESIDRIRRVVPRATLIPLKHAAPYALDDLFLEFRRTVREAKPDWVVYPKHFVSLGGRARKALVVHDLLLYDRPADQPRRKRLFRFLYGLSIRRADLCVAVSDFTAQRLSHWVPSASSETVVVGEAVPLEFAHASDAVTALAPLGAADDPAAGSPRASESSEVRVAGGLARDISGVLPTWNLLFVGEPGGRKEFRFALGVCAELASRGYGVGLHHVGPRAAPDLVAGFLAAGRTQMVEHGHVSDAQLVQLYRSSDALLLPSVYEGFGLPMVEAISQGCWVIYGDTPALLEVAANLNLPGAPTERSASAWADAISRSAVRGTPVVNLGRTALDAWGNVSRAILDACGQ